MAVKVCDALCGFGKTSACIRMMNERTDCKFIFVTQFLSEVERIRRGCAERKFVSPSGDASKRKTKLSSIHGLMRAGRNIATTHSLFVNYTEETKQLIVDGGYTLVLDESVDVLCASEVGGYDMDILKKSEVVQENGEHIEWVFDDYISDVRGKFREEMLMARSKNLLRFEKDFFFWSLPPELFTCFRDVYVLTYLFHAQPMKCFFEIHGIGYELIGVRKERGRYIFCDVSEMNRAVDLRDKIHIVDNPRLNAIGEDRTALSLSWYRHSADAEDSSELEQMRKNISNVFKNIFKATSGEILWTTFKEFAPMVRGNGYQNSFITYNMRASNEYADRRYLAYCVNTFLRPLERRYYQERGSEWDADGYALSVLVQWLFRSAIRRGEEVWLYLPSQRMRYLLTEWLQLLAEGRDLEPIVYKSPRKSRAKPGAKRGRPPKKERRKNNKKGE